MLFSKRISLRNRDIPTAQLISFRLAARQLSIALSLLTPLIFSGCQTHTPPVADQVLPSDSGRMSKVSASREANIFANEAMLAKPYAIIGGTVSNRGSEKLEKLSVEIELRRRVGGSVERREASVEPSDLAPGEEGKYSLKVLSDEWSGSRVVALRSGASRREVAFNILPGAKRPPEKFPETKATAPAPRQKSRSNGNEFINTPDNPIKVP